MAGRGRAVVEGADGKFVPFVWLIYGVRRAAASLRRAVAEPSSGGKGDMAPAPQALPEPVRPLPGSTPGLGHAAMRHRHHKLPEPVPWPGHSRLGACSGAAPAQSCRSQSPCLAAPGSSVAWWITLWVGGGVSIARVWGVVGWFQGRSEGGQPGGFGGLTSRMKRHGRCPSTEKQVVGSQAILARW